jgi:hypothetical protein
MMAWEFDMIARFSGPEFRRGSPGAMPKGKPSGVKITVWFNHCDVLFPCTSISTTPVRTTNHF